MKKLFVFCAILGSFGAASAQTPTVTDSLSYALGVQIGEYFKNSGYTNVNMKEFELALQSTMAGKAAFDGQKAQQYLTKQSQAIAKKKGEENKKKGDTFLAANKTKQGVITTASGLQYEVIKMGTGAKPLPTDKVKTHYHGTLIDGTVFDSSVDRGEPITFPVNGVIQGWQEALQLMPVGSKFRLFVPWNLAYGDRGAGGKIGPYETLIFEVELLEINPK